MLTVKHPINDTDYWREVHSDIWGFFKSPVRWQTIRVTEIKVYFGISGITVKMDKLFTPTKRNSGESSQHPASAEAKKAFILTLQGRLKVTLHGGYSREVRLCSFQFLRKQIWEQQEWEMVKRSWMNSKNNQTKKKQKQLMRNRKCKPCLLVQT